MANIDETVARSTIARYLRDVNSNWTVDEEAPIHKDGVLRGKIDLLITQSGRPPVPLELKWSRSNALAQDDAAGRLGVWDGHRFYNAVAVTIDDSYGSSVPTLEQALGADEPVFAVQVARDVDDKPEIWPQNNRRVRANLRVLANLIEQLQIPHQLVKEETSWIAYQIDLIARDMHQIIGDLSNSDAIFYNLQGWSDKDNPLDACRAVCMIWTIAISKQNDLANFGGVRMKDVKTSRKLRQDHSGLFLRHLQEEWSKVLEVGYISLMVPAIGAVRALDGHDDLLYNVAEQIESMVLKYNRTGTRHIYNYFGEVWQMLMGVSARKAKAAFYTRPTLAEFGATLVAHRLRSRSPESIRSLNVWDPACGTGTLLSTMEQAIRRTYREVGGNALNLHSYRMENHIYGTDIDILAGVITSERLTNLDIEDPHQGGHVSVLESQHGGTLEWLDPDDNWVRVKRDMYSAGGVYNEGETICLGSIDVIIMNPPYTRPASGRKIAFSSKDLRKKARVAGYSGMDEDSGYVGDFYTIANMRLAPGGVLLMVMPATAARGFAWIGFRTEVEKDFEEIIVVSNASHETGSMSADTGQGELLLIATKKESRPVKWTPTQITYVNLHDMPDSCDQAYLLGEEAAALVTKGAVGMLSQGYWRRVQQHVPGEAWDLVEINSQNFANIIRASAAGKIYDPRTGQSLSIAIDTVLLGDLFTTGPGGASIGYIHGAATERGAYTIYPLSDYPNETFACKALWTTDYKQQRSILVEPTHGGVVRNSNLAGKRHQQRSQWLMNFYLRWTSEKVNVVHTSEPVHGGIASFNALQAPAGGHPYGVAESVAIFYNSIYGALPRLRWGHAAIEGRSMLSNEVIVRLLCPNFAADTPEAMFARNVAIEEFERLSTLELLSFAQCWQDPARAEIDRTCARMLGLPSGPDTEELLDLYRQMFAREPSVHGRQKGTKKALGIA